LLAAGRKAVSSFWEAGNGRRSKEIRITLSKPQSGAAVELIKHMVKY
jgi:hypothetical protein